MVASKRPPTPRPVEKTPIRATQHPSIGRGFAYSMDMRLQAMTVKLLGRENDALFQHMRGNRTHPSKRTTKRHLHRLQTRGHFRPYVRQGNKRASVLRGFSSFLLVLYRMAFPKCNQAEMQAFLWNAWGRHQNPPRFFSNSQISKCEDRMGLSRKRGSTTAKQANLPVNLMRRHAFWTMPYPLGIADCRAEDMIDVDEAGITQDDAGRRYGKSFIGVRVREAGNYGHGKNLTLKCAIAGRNGPNDRFYRFDDEPTNTLTFYRFIRDIIIAIGPGWLPGNRRTFTMDNLTAHKHPLVTQLIVHMGHRYVFRAPYNARDGPIEYFFNTIQTALITRMYEIDNEQDLRNAVHDIINSIPSFVPFFHGVGFR